MTNPVNYRAVAKRIEESFFTISLLSDVLLNNGGYKGGYKGAPDDVDNPAQINDLNESGIQKAIKLLAEAGHRDFCRMATDLEIPE